MPYWTKAYPVASLWMVNSTCSEIVSWLDWLAVFFNSIFFSIVYVSWLIPRLLCIRKCQMVQQRDPIECNLIWQWMSRIWEFCLFISTINIPSLVKCSNYCKIGFFLSIALTLFCQLGFGIKVWKLLILLFEYHKSFNLWLCKAY